MALGNNIRHLREAHKWTLERLSERSGVDVGTLSALEKRDSKRSVFAQQIADAFEVPLRYLLADELPNFETMDQLEVAINEKHIERRQKRRTVLATPDRVLDGYIRLEHLPYQPSMGGGRAQGPDHVVQHIDVLESFVRQKVGSVNPNRIKILTGVGTSMQPKIKDQDIVFVDVEHRWIDAPGYYVIDVAGLLLLKKAMILSTGVLILRSENVDEFPDEERHDLRKAAETITVCGKVLAWWTLMQG